MAKGSTMTHYCDWAISILIQPASYSRPSPSWEALSWLHTGSALFTVTSLPCSSPSIYLWMHLSSPLLLKIKSHYCACAARAACVTLAHSVRAKNILSDVVVMQQAHVIRTSKKSPRCIWNVLASLHHCAVRNSDGRISVCESINRYYTGRRPRFNDDCLLLFVLCIQWWNPIAELDPPWAELTILILSKLTFLFITLKKHIHHHQPFRLRLITIWVIVEMKYVVEYHQVLILPCY